MKSELYFRHDVYALDDNKLMKLVLKYHEAGYGVFWAVVERLTADTSHYINKDDLSMQVAVKLCSSNTEEISNIIDYSIQIDLLKENDNGVYSERVIEQCEEVIAYKNQQRMNVQKRWENYKGNTTVEPPKSEGNTNNNNKNNNKNNNDNYNKVLDLYTKVCVSLPKVVKMTEVRKSHCKALFEKFGEENIKKGFELAEQSDFLKKGQGTWNGANFDWLINSSNFVKVLEGNYNNKNRSYVVTGGQLTKDENGGFAL